MKPTEKTTGNGLPDQFKGPIDLLEQLQAEIESIKNGTMEESRGRVVFFGRRLQLKIAELQLQYARLTKGKLPLNAIPLLMGQQQAEEKVTKQS